MLPRGGSQFLLREWLASDAMRSLPQRGYIQPAPVDVDQLKREAEAGRKLMKELQCSNS